MNILNIVDQIPVAQQLPFGLSVLHYIHFTQCHGFIKALKIQKPQAYGVQLLLSEQFHGSCVSP
jgi:hypothetical protein